MECGVFLLKDEPVSLYVIFVSKTAAECPPIRLCTWQRISCLIWRQVSSCRAQKYPPRPLACSLHKGVEKNPYYWVAYLPNGTWNHLVYRGRTVFHLWKRYGNKNERLSRSFYAPMKHDRSCDLVSISEPWKTFSKTINFLQQVPSAQFGTKLPVRNIFTGINSRIRRYDSCER